MKAGAAPRAAAPRAATRSSSAVVTPGAMAATTSSRTSCTMRLAARMRATSSAVLIWTVSRTPGSAPCAERELGCGEDALGSPDALHLGHLPALLVEALQRPGLVGVLLHALLHVLGLVVVALHEGGPVLVAEPRPAGRIRRYVEDGAAPGAAAPAADALDDELLRHLVGGDPIDALAHRPEQLLEVLGLRDRPGIAVEDEPLRHVRPRQAVLHEGVRDLVGDELARVHDGLDLLAELGPARLVIAEHVAGRDVRDAVRLGEQLRLGTLPCAGRAEEDEDHR